MSPRNRRCIVWLCTKPLSEQCMRNIIIPPKKNMRKIREDQCFPPKFTPPFILERFRDQEHPGMAHRATFSFPLQLSCVPCFFHHAIGTHGIKATMTDIIPFGTLSHSGIFFMTVKHTTTSDFVRFGCPHPSVKYDMSCLLCHIVGQ